mmetsp:Transcript_28019/g.79227  ORF Transcript_28019/g.79227 Transcript_28019/m.79227 type:complete len:202 (-) Transcript_28019:200-805(-)|eukprot:CAMPEP_0117673610 /NCGR_PEP_ID=MMETSP0804-20121206/14566_1 /TAXON_ID=1074897 /ORGANISM="Tetraselmis astigmatica, Strain CCMP880" /LENGTH=201 /DNA_ID=CAMNT_0005482363 /DNA_START=104 /DNA_END=709 /DNA_ORIENTATION=-
MCPSGGCKMGTSGVPDSHVAMSYDDHPSLAELARCLPKKPDQTPLLPRSVVRRRNSDVGWRAPRRQKPVDLAEASTGHFLGRSSSSDQAGTAPVVPPVVTEDYPSLLEMLGSGNRQQSCKPGSDLKYEHVRRRRSSATVGWWRRHTVEEKPLAGAAPGKLIATGKTRQPHASGCTLFPPQNKRASDFPSIPSTVCDEFSLA